MDLLLGTIYAKDVALGMIQIMEKGYNQPVNLGSGKETTIREIVNIIKSIVGNVEISGILQNQVEIKKD